MKKKHLLFFILVFSVSTPLLSQNLKDIACKDSFGATYQTPLFIKLERLYLKAKKSPLASLNNAYEIMKISKDEKLEIIHIKTHDIIALSNYKLNNFAEANKHIRIAYQMLKPNIKHSLFGVTIIKNYAQCLYKSNNLEYSLIFYLEALNELNRICSEPSKIKFDCLNKIAQIYAFNNDENKALDYYSKAIEEADRLNSNLYSSKINNYIGSYYLKKSDHKQAYSFFKKALLLLDSTGVIQNQYITNINENIAKLYFKSNRVKDALKIFTTNVSTRKAYTKKNKTVESLISVLECNIILLNFKNAKSNINTIEQYFIDKKDLQIYNDPNYNNFYKLKLLFYKKAKKTEMYTKASSMYIDYLNKKNIFNNEFNQKAINEYNKLQEHGLKKELILERRIAKEKEKLIEKRKWLELATIALFILIISTLILSIHVRNSKHKRIKQENLITKLKLSNEKLEKQRLNKLLDTKQKDIINIISFSSMKIKYLNSILNKIQKITEENNIKKLFNPIILNIKSQISIQRRLIALKKDLTEVNVDFESKLLEIYPDLTKTEREICAFIKLKFTTKEIAQIRNSSVDSVKMVRSRIRKKINLSQIEELEKKIQSI